MVGWCHCFHCCCSGCCGCCCCCCCFGGCCCCSCCCCAGASFAGRSFYIDPSYIIRSALAPSSQASARAIAGSAASAIVRNGGEVAIRPNDHIYCSRRNPTPSNSLIAWKKQCFVQLVAVRCCALAFVRGGAFAVASLRLARDAVHTAMRGYTGVCVGPVLQRATLLLVAAPHERLKKGALTARARVRERESERERERETYCQTERRAREATGSPWGALFAGWKKKRDREGDREKWCRPIVRFRVSPAPPFRGRSTTSSSKSHVCLLVFSRTSSVYILHAFFKKMQRGRDAIQSHCEPFGSREEGAGKQRKHTARNTQARSGSAFTAVPGSLACSPMPTASFNFHFPCSFMAPEWQLVLPFQGHRETRGHAICRSHWPASTSEGQRKTRSLGGHAFSKALRGERD